MDKYNFLDFIEIGTSDFETEIENATNITKGMSIEPLKFYLDKLPNKQNVTKLNIAISDENGECIVYYVPEETIIKYNFPNWVRGCNSINSYHKSVYNLIIERGLIIKDIIMSYNISKKTLYDTMNEYNINGIFYLKIDTEGHDCIILTKFLKDITDNEMLPHKILFESNSLTDRNDVINIIISCLHKGYDIIKSDFDTLLYLNLNRIQNKTKFTECIDSYYIMDYANNYDPISLPHENTLEAAKKYCIEHKLSGVTFQYDRYEVRCGTYLKKDNSSKVKSWVFL